VPRSRADRFIAAFHAIEQSLRSRVAADRHLRFYDLVDRVAAEDAGVDAFRLDLKEFADLRNAIVHERGSGRAIANPYPDTVAAIEGIRDLLASPPLLVDVIRIEDLKTCQPTTPILEAARVMRAGDFSQLPVVNGSDVVTALLTAETITRFVGASGTCKELSLVDATVADALPHAERFDNYMIVDVDATVFRVIGQVRTASDEGRSLDAVIVSDGVGPVTLATPYDMPRLLAAGHPLGAIGQ
jgi:CBS domain-containing protein